MSVSFSRVPNVVEIPRPRTEDAKEGRIFSSLVENVNSRDLDKLGLLSSVTKALSPKCCVMINGNMRHISACFNHSEWRAECKIPNDVESEVVEPRKDVYPHPCVLRVTLLSLDTLRFVDGVGGQSIELTHECNQALTNVEFELSDVVR